MTGSERMAGVDSAWLHMDRSTNPMVVNTLVVLDGAVSADVVTAVLTERVVARFARFRQRTTEPLVTFGPLMAPRWQPTELDIERHVRSVRLPPPGDHRALRDYIAGQAPLPLAHDQPLWQVHVIGGYGTGTALLLRTHHALADGTALVRVLEAMTHPDHSPEPAGPHPAPPSHPPGSGLPTAGTRLHRTASLWGEMDPVAKLGGGLGRRATALVGPLDGTKDLDWTPLLRVEEARAVARRHGATINDVLLAVVGGGFGRYLRGHGRCEPVEVVEVVVPVNLRTTDDRGPDELGNHFGLVFAPLRTDDCAAAERIRSTKTAMDRIKASPEADIVFDALNAMGHTPAHMAHAWSDSFSQRASAVVTNIVGPRTPVSFAGVPVPQIVVFVPSTGPLGIGVSFFSYAGGVALGVITDHAIVPDATALLHDLTAATAELTTPTP